MRTERLSPARKDTLLRRLEKNATRSNIAAALQQTGDRRAALLFEMLCDPAYRHHSFARLAEKVGLGAHEALDLYRRAKLDLAMVPVYESLPEVAKDTCEAARSRTESCRKCGGKGKLGTQPCSECDGSGSIRIPGDAEARRIAFRACGLIR